MSRDNTRHPAANLTCRRLKASGHDVFPVNPHMPTFDGDRCYPDLPSIPGGVDGAVIVTRPDGTDRIVHQCSVAGVRRVWMHQSLAKGSSVSPAAVEYCRQHAISVNAIGPFELSEYLGLALVYGALAVTAPFRATGRPVTVTV